MIVLSEGWHNARKRHVCYDCGKYIQPGSRYFKQSNIWEGEFNCIKSHEDCHNAVMIVYDPGIHDCEWPRLADFQDEDRAHVASVDPVMAARLWAVAT